MTYNTTKRSLEKSAGIIAIVFAAVSMVVALVLLGNCIFSLSHGTMLAEDLVKEILEIEGDISDIRSLVGVVGIIASVFELAIGICTIIFAAKVIPSPVNSDGTIKNNKTSGICLVVFSFLSGFIIPAILEIISLTEKDFDKKDPERKQEIIIR